MNNNSYVWCVFQAYDIYSVSIGQSYSLFCVVVVGIILGIWKHRVKHELSRIQKFILRGTLAWMISIIIKNIINIVVFVVFIEDNVSNGQVITYLSMIFCIFEYTASFCILTWFLVIPSAWLYQIFLHPNQSIITYKDRIRINRIFKGLKFIQYYIKFRFLYLLFPLSVLLYRLLVGKVSPSLANVYFISVSTQSILLFLFYIVGLVLIKVNLRLLMVPEKDFRQLAIEYICLMFVSVNRFIYNIVFNFIGLNYSPKDETCENEYDDNRKITISLIIGITILYMMPILLIYKIYWPASHRESIALLNSTDE